MVCLKKYRFLLWVFLSLGLIGCGVAPKTVTTSLTRFHVADIQQDKGSFVILPEDGSLADSLEFKSYADQLANQLTHYGYQQYQADPKDRDRQADISVSLSFQQSEKQEMRYQQRPQFVPGYGFSIIGNDVLWRSHSHFISRSVPVIVTLKDVRVKLVMARAATRIFESQAEYKGNLPLQTVMPYMIKSIFSGFPGKNGETIQVKLPIEPVGHTNQ